MNITTGLTDRERQVLTLLRDGLTAKEAAARLGLTRDTIQTYTKRIMERLGAKNITQAVIIAIRCGYIKLSKNKNIGV